jgi:hypothetical protein
MMKKSLVLAAILFAASQALAQTAGEVANHAVPLGKGPGVIGWGTAVPGVAGGLLSSTGPTTDPAFQPLTLATAAQYLAGTSSAPIAPTVIYPTEVTVTFGATTTFDFSTFINASVTLTGNITTMSVANVTAGKAGMITFIQDATGTRTITAWNTIFKFSGTLPVLSTAPNAIDVLSYSCRSAAFCVASLLTSVHNP